MSHRTGQFERLKFYACTSFADAFFLNQSQALLCLLCHHHASYSPTAAWKSSAYLRVDSNEHQENVMVICEVKRLQGAGDRGKTSQWIQRRP